MKSKIVKSGSILAADDLKVGRVVAVHSAARPAQPPPSSMPPEIERRIRVEFSAPPVQLPPGVPFRIKALNLPFILVAVIEPSGESEAPFIIDASKHRLIKVPPAFVRAIGRFGKRKQSERIEEPPFEPNR
jgi:hypothetical protein